MILELNIKYKIKKYKNIKWKKPKIATNKL